MAASAVGNNKMPLYAKFKSGRTLSLQVFPTDSIVTLKKEVANLLPGDTVSSDLQIVYAGKPLQDEHSLEYYKVGKESIIHITVKRDVTRNEASEKTSNRRREQNKKKEKIESLKKSTIDEFGLMETLAGFDATDGVDICFAFDTTGSMSNIIANVRQQVNSTCQRLFQEIPGLRISIMVIGDYCDQDTSYVVASLDLSNNPDAITTFVKRVRGSSGGDAPEAYEWALHKARKLSWREEASCAKALVMIGDMHPHSKYETTAMCDWHEELDELAKLGVKVYGVQANYGVSASPFYERLAERTGGFYLRFSDFSLMTKMFLALCYREAGVEKLEEYATEIEAGNTGGKGKEMTTILAELRKPEQTKVVKKDSRIRCNAAWYVQSPGRSNYTYFGEKDYFSRYAGCSSDSRSTDPEVDRQFEYGLRAMNPPDPRGPSVLHIIPAGGGHKDPPPQRGGLMGWVYWAAGWQ